MTLRTRWTAALAIIALSAAAPSAGAHALQPRRARNETAPRYYLALGDSYSTGFQPTAHGGDENTNQGYVNDLFAYERKDVTGLRLVQMGCPGDTTTSLLTGSGNTRLAHAFRCDRRGGSQLAAAVAFLRAHHRRGEVPLVTLDIGTNDVDSCTLAADPSACLTASLATVRSNLPRILSSLRRAAPAGTVFAGMNLYEPGLSYYLLPASDPTQKRGLASVELIRRINDVLATDYERAHFKLADVASAFDTYDSTAMVAWNGATVPQDVALLCAWTWNCTPPPVGPNIHPNALGYGVIAQAFEKVVGRL